MAKRVSLRSMNTEVRDENSPSFCPVQSEIHSLFPHFCTFVSKSTKGKEYFYLDPDFSSFVEFRI